MVSEIRLEKCPNGSKVKLRDHLKQVEKTLGRRPEALKQPDFPVELDYLYRWFLDLRQSQPITFQEISSWSSVMRLSPTPAEIETIKILDRVYWRHIGD